MTILLPLRLAATHRDYELLSRLEKALYRHAKGEERFRKEIPLLLRQAIDEVIDAPRSKRFTLNELEKTEKTYLGTKVEILLRNHLGLPRGEKLDVLVDGIEVDIKNTVRTAWTIPSEALGHPCILIRSDEVRARCSFGLVVIHPEVLNAGRNRDDKTTIKAGELVNVHWLLRDEAYPANFWLSLAPDVRRAIVSPRGGTARVEMLFRLHQGRPISRGLILALAQQLDAMKRVRANGGARDKLLRDGILILSGKTQRSAISEAGLPFCAPDEFISYSPSEWPMRS